MLNTEVQEKYYTIADYFALEDASPVRHEFNNGNLLPMAGGILPHNVVKGELYTLLNITLRQPQYPHVVLNSDTKVRMERLNRFVYPDVTVSDGTPVYYETPEGKIRRDTIINPLFVAEVLSEETRENDKGSKFEDYCTIPTFREYLLIEPETVWIKQLYLQEPKSNLWKIDLFTNPDDNITLHSLGITLNLSDLYKVLDKLPKATQ
jgi:Uma2 family endonuclease